MKSLILLPLLTFNQVNNPIKIAIIDTGLESKYSYTLCPEGSQDFTGTDTFDYTGHGTNIAGIIWENSNRPDICIINLKFFHTKKYGPFNTVSSVIRAFKEATRLGVDIINFSAEGGAPVKEEERVIKKALDQGIIVVVPSGNQDKNLNENCNVYPACYPFREYKNFHVVGRNDAAALRDRNFGYGGPVTDYRPGHNVKGFDHTMTGTSQATAVMTSELVRQLVKVNIPKRSCKKGKKCTK